MLAEAYVKTGKYADASASIEQAKSKIEANDERWWEPEIYRISGDRLVAQSSDYIDDAENFYAKAVHLAREQEARSLELRASIGMARLYELQNR